MFTFPIKSNATINNMININYYNTTRSTEIFMQLVRPLLCIIILSYAHLEMPCGAPHKSDSWLLMLFMHV